MIRKIINFFQEILNFGKRKPATKAESYSGNLRALTFTNKTLPEAEIADLLPERLEKYFLSKPEKVTLPAGFKLWRVCEAKNSLRFSEDWIDSNTMEQIIQSLRIEEFNAIPNIENIRNNNQTFQKNQRKLGFYLQIELKKAVTAYIVKTSKQNILNYIPCKYGYRNELPFFKGKLNLNKYKGEVNQIIIPQFSNKMLNQTENEYGRVTYFRSI